MPVSGIVNVKKTKEYDVYIGRTMGTYKWGNPYQIGIHYTRKGCIEMYEYKLLFKILKSREVTYEDLMYLVGKTLGCFCKPKSCHGDVIAKYVELAERLSREDFIEECWKITRGIEDEKIKKMFGFNS